MTQSNYDIALERVQEAFPDHPLLPVLRRGHSVLNEKRITDLVLKIQEAAQAAPEEEEEDTWMEEPGILMNDDDPELRQLFIQKSNLFVKRAKFSNRLHDCRTDRERSAVVDAILDTQREIEDQFQKIRTYRETGTIVEESDTFNIPTDGAALVRQLNSLRVLISRKRKEIEELYHEEKTPPVLQKIDKCDAKLKHYELHIKHVQKEIERRKSDSLLE